MRYLATFVGVLKGAIGARQRFRLEVEADNEEAANLNLYETHEHISQLILIKLDWPKSKD